MTDLANQRRLAAEVMGIGVNRVWMNPEAYKDISVALTREDIRKLISEEKIGKRDIRGVSRGRARKVDETRAYGHRKGHGSRSGAKGARNPKKEQWMKKIRALRSQLKEMKRTRPLKSPLTGNYTAKPKAESTEAGHTLLPM